MRLEDLGKDAAELWILSSDSELAGLLRIHFVLKIIGAFIGLPYAYGWALMAGEFWDKQPWLVWAYLIAVPLILFLLIRSVGQMILKKQIAIAEREARAAREAQQSKRKRKKKT